MHVTPATATITHSSGSQQYVSDREFVEWSILPTVTSPNCDSTINKATGLVTAGALTGTFTVKGTRYDGESSTAVVIVN